MNDYIKEFRDIIKEAVKDKTSPYDTQGTVKRVEGKTAWVSFNGSGIDETPVLKTIDCKKGDTVQVRVSGKSATLTGNLSAPPTDDKVARKALEAAGTLAKNVSAVNESVTEITEAIEEGEFTVEGVYIQYILSTSNAEVIPYDDMEWSDELPEYVAGCYYWTRTVTVTEDGEAHESEPMLDLGAQLTAEVDVAQKSTNNHFWFDDTGAYVTEQDGDASRGYATRVTNAGILQTYNGSTLTSWTGSGVAFYRTGSNVALASFGSSGIGFDPSVPFTIGNSNSYIKWVRENDQWKIKVVADEIQFGGSSLATTLSDMEDDISDVGNVASGAASTASGAASTASAAASTASAAASAASNAAKTATNFITVSGAGINVHAANDSSNYANISSSGVSIYKSGAMVASFGSTAQIGSSSGNHITISSDGLTCYNGSTESGVFEFSGNSMLIQSKHVGTTGESSLFLDSWGTGAYNADTPAMEFTASDGGIAMSSSATSVALGKNTKTFFSSNSSMLGTSSNKWDAGYVVTMHTGSDKKDKDTVKDLDFAEEFIMSLNPVTYMWKMRDHRRTHMGFIAQEVAEYNKGKEMLLSIATAAYKTDDEDATIPEYHGEEVSDETLTWTLSYEEFIAPIVKMIQKHQLRIDTLERRIS